MNHHYPSNTTGPLSNPGDLMAAVPGILGFYPHESLVIVGLQMDQNEQTLTCGPVLRADLSHWLDLTSALAAPTLAEYEVFFAFVVTRSPEAHTVREMIDGLYTLHDDADNAVIDACWVLSEIATGSHYSLSFGEVPPQWESGAVPCIALSPAMQPLLNNGGLPALTRDDTVEYFAQLALDDDTRDIIDGITQLAYCRGQDLHERIENQLPGPAQAVEDADRALKNAPARPLVSPDDDPWLPTTGDPEEDNPVDDDIIALMTCLSRSRLRDCIVATAIAEPERAATILLYIARLCSGVIRANALSIWAIIAISVGLSSWATAALKVAHSELAGHGLSTALLNGLALGGDQALINAVLVGSKEQRTLLRVHVSG